MSIKKFLLGGFSIVLISLSSSCSQNEEEQVPSNKDDVVSAFFSKYDADFVAKYGKPSAAQSWDFSDRVGLDEIEVLPCIEKEGTRAVSSAAVVTNNWDEADPRIHSSVLKPVATLNEFSYIKANLANVEVKDWTPNIFGVHDVWVWYCHGNGSSEVTTYSIGVHSCAPWTTDIRSGSLPDEYITYIPIMGSAQNSGWYAGYGYRGGPGYRVDTSDFEDNFNDEFPDWVVENENWSYFDPDLPADWDYETGLATEREFFWYAMTDDPNIVLTDPSIGIDDWADIKAQYELKTYKEIVTPNGAVYWCFDCDHDGEDYSDLIYLVEPVIAAKRYLIEDVGAFNDFDFNDIVVDVRDNGIKQTAVVRAMGGTLDFDLTIGEKTWKKRESTYNVSTAYNVTPGSIDYDATLATFEVEGWDPLDNNISVTVNSRLSNKAIVDIPFPKQGDIPHIIAVSPDYKFPLTDGSSIPWMPEQVPIPDDLWTE